MSSEQISSEPDGTKSETSRSTPLGLGYGLGIGVQFGLSQRFRFGPRFRYTRTQGTGENGAYAKADHIGLLLVSQLQLPLGSRGAIYASPQVGFGGSLHEEWGGIYLEPGAFLGAQWLASRNLWLSAELGVRGHLLREDKGRKDATHSLWQPTLQVGLAYVM